MDQCLGAMGEIEIRPMQSLAEMKDIEEIQLTIWGKDEREMMPGHLFHALQHNGAALLGAFDGLKLVGFTLAVLATVEGLKDRIDQVAAARLKMFSVIAGVLPEYRNAGIGGSVLEDLLAEAAEAGKPVRGHVENFNPALRLYERLGFVKVGVNGVRHLIEWLPNGRRNGNQANSGLLQSAAGE